MIRRGDGPLLLAGLAALAAGAGVFALLAWGAAPAELRAALAAWAAARPLPLALAAGFALAAAALAALWRLRALQGFAPRVARALELLRESRPDLRLGPECGAPAELVEAVNRLAEDYAQRRRASEAEIARATEALAEERDLLAAVLAELPAAALACSRDGRILLYTPRATALVRQVEPDAWLGLGRTIFTLFRRSAIVHALAQLDAAAARGEKRAATALLATRGGALLHARFTPLAGRSLRGFFVTLAPVAEAAPAHLADARTDARRPLASLRAAAESLRDYPEMPGAQRARFLQIVEEECAALAAALPPAEATAQEWPLEDAAAETVLALAQDGIAAATRKPVQAPDPAPARWLRVESFSLTALLRDFALRAVKSAGAENFRLELRDLPPHVALELRWQPPALLPPERWREWEHAPLAASGYRLPLSPAEILRRQNGELWQQLEGGDALLRLLLTPAGPPEPAAAASAPQFDFATPAAAGQSPEDRRLSSLSFTAFDTETTGLDPSGGDEVIALGAIRIVNGRILSREVFESLVATRRRIDPAAQRVHGIGAELLAGQPDIAEVLPRFRRFCEDTVLIGHNSAFDLRFFELQAQRTGVRFTQPVLDTLLLGSLLYAEPGALTLEALADSLGVSVLGRHTALGDAILTAEVFLRLLPLLEARGIGTLAQALEASRRSPYAALRY